MHINVLHIIIKYAVSNFFYFLMKCTVNAEYFQSVKLNY